MFALSAQTVSRLTRVPDHAVKAFHQRRLGDDCTYLVLDGVWLKVRRAFGPRRALLLVAYGVGRDGRRELLAETRGKAGWEGLLNDLFQRGLTGQRYPTLVQRLKRELPELLHFFSFPRHLWRNCAPPTSSNAAS